MSLAIRSSTKAAEVVASSRYALRICSERLTPISLFHVTFSQLCHAPIELLRVSLQCKTHMLHGEVLFKIHVDPRRSVRTHRLCEPTSNPSSMKSGGRESSLHHGTLVWSYECLPRKSEALRSIHRLPCTRFSAGV